MATRKVYCSYQEIIDLHTESDKVTAIGFHVPDTDTPHKMFGGLYDQFKKVKYLGMSVTFVPVARLPVDPLGVSYEAGEPGMDPRDVVNPILLHGCHGNDMGTILNNLYSGQIGDIGNQYNTDSTDIFEYMNGAIVEGSELDFHILENLYYKALVDNTWQKAHPQKGFRKSGLHPMVYNVVANHQINPSLPYNAPDVIANSYGVPSGEVWEAQVQQAGVRVRANQSTAFGKLHLMTNRLVPYGWMDTRNVIIQSKNGDYVSFASSEHPLDEAMADLLDKTTTRSKFEPIYMMMCLLPPAYKTEQYFRCIINHNFVFAGFRGMSFNNSDMDESAPSVFNLNEQMSVGDDNGGDDNGGGDDPPADETPVITLSSPGVGSTYSSYSIDGSDAVSLSSHPVTLKVTSNGNTFDLQAATISSDKILLVRTANNMTYDLGNLDGMTVFNDGGNTELVSLLESGEYVIGNE